MSSIRSFLILTVLLLPSSTAFCQRARNWQESAAAIDRAAPILMGEHHTPGVSVALVEAGKIAWTGCYGIRAEGDPAPVTPDTVFEACSMSKPLFAYGFLKLVEQKQFDLDKPLVNYLANPYLKDQPLHRQITAKMVLTHTTGFPNWRKGGWRAGGKLPVRFQPGSRFGYSGEGFWYLQQVVEHVTGEPLDSWSQRVLLKPLNMRHSSYVWRNDYSKLAAVGHNADGSVKKDRRKFDRANAAFTLYTTPSDYARFLNEVMNPDRRAKHSLSASMLKRMLKPSVTSDKAGISRSLGWAVRKEGSSTLVGHSGANGTGFRCVCEFDRKTGRGIVIMTNSVSGKAVWQGLLKSSGWLSSKDEE